VLVQHLIDLVLGLVPLVLANFSGLGNLVLVPQSEIFASQMLQKRILKQRKEEQNINSHFSQIKKKTSIHFVVKRVLVVKNQKKM